MTPHPVLPSARLPNVRHLETFYHVVSHRGICRAAGKPPHRIQQPAISEQIQALEQDIGHKLFDRQPFRLTQEGRQLYAIVARFFEELQTALPGLRGGLQTCVRIGADDLLIRHYLPEIVRPMAEAEGLRFTFQSASAMEMIERLQAGKIDLVIAPTAGRVPPGLASVGDSTLGAYAFDADPGSGWVRFVIALVFAGLMAVSLRLRERPTLGPSLLTALALSAAGLWFLPRPESSGFGATALRLIEIPLPDWGKWLFGPGRASPIFYSALIPFGLSVLGYFWKGSRQVMAGVCLGFAAFLSYCAWSGAPAIAWMPLRFIAIPFLLVNVALCLLFGRALMRKEAA